MGRPLGCLYLQWPYIGLAVNKAVEFEGFRINIFIIF